MVLAARVIQLVELQTLFQKMACLAPLLFGFVLHVLTVCDLELATYWLVMGNMPLAPEAILSTALTYVGVIS